MKRNNRLLLSRKYAERLAAKQRFYVGDEYTSTFGRVFLITHFGFNYKMELTAYDAKNHGVELHHFTSRNRVVYFNEFGSRIERNESGWKRTKESRKHKFIQRPATVDELSQLLILL